MSIRTAIQSKQLLQFTYEGHFRVGQPHTFGVDKKGHEALRAYQVEGMSSSGMYRGWKMFHVQEIKGLTILDRTFEHPQLSYKKNDSAFLDIYAQL